MKFPTIVEHDCSLLHPQNAILIHSVIWIECTHSHSIYLRFNVNIILPSTQYLANLLSMFYKPTLHMSLYVHTMHATFPAHPAVLDLNTKYQAKSGPLVTTFEDRGQCLQIWWVAANIFNKQYRTADKGWSSRLRGKQLQIPKCYSLSNLESWSYQAIKLRVS